MKLYVEGKLQTRTWEKDGQIRRKTEVIAENVQILYRPEQYRNGVDKLEPKNENEPVELQNDVPEPETTPEKEEGFFNGLF